MRVPSPSPMGVFPSLLAMVSILSVTLCDVIPLHRDIDINYKNRHLLRNELDAETILVPSKYKLPKKYESSEDSGGKETPSETHSGPITRLWGIEDQEALVGHAFTLKIPKGAFSGAVSSFEVSNLPSWLQFVNVTNTFYGVPTAEHFNEHYYITVTARGDRPLTGKAPSVQLESSQGAGIRRVAQEGIVAHDTFSVSVLKRHGHVSGCGSSQEVTKLVLDISDSWGSLTPLKRVRTAIAFAKTFGLSIKAVSLLPSPPGTILSVPVGCDGAVLHQGAVRRVSKLQDKLSELLKVSCTQWRLETETLTKQTGVRRTKRIRRAPDYPEGDLTFDPEYDYNYEYEYDDYDPNDPQYSGGDYSEPDERVVPSLATPVFPSSVSTMTGTDDPLLPPVLRPVPISTPVLVPVKPTRVVDISSSVSLQSSVSPTRPLSPPTSISLQPPTSSPVDEVTDHLVRNFPPKVENRIDKMALVAGLVFRFQIPEDTFSDLEDGNTRKLRLVLLDSSSNNLGPRSWIQFDPLNQEIYALPLEDNMGYWTYFLEAVDSGGKSVKESIKIHIHQPKEARNYHHRYTATLRTAKKYEYDFAYQLDWQVRVVEKIAALFDNRTDSINIRSISENPTKVSWTNVTIVDPSSTSCPEMQIDQMNEVLFGDMQEEEISRGSIEAFKPEFHLKRVHIHYDGNCEYMASRNEKKEDVPSPAVNKEPEFMNQVDYLKATAGIMFRKQVPSDTCYDFEDGSVRNMRMRLYTQSMGRLPLDYWLQFDSNNQEFYGLPLDSDVGTEVFYLECEDSDGGKIKDSLELVVDPSPLTTLGAPQPPALFSLKFDQNYTAFMNQPLLKALLIRRLGSAFGDTDGRFVSVTELSPGSVVVSWFNTTFMHSALDPCPNDVIDRMRNTMFTRENAIKAEFADHFLPEFVLVDGSINPMGTCLSPDTPQHIPPPDVGVVNEEDLSGAVSEDQTDDDYLLTFLVPSILMGVMLILAAIGACCLYRHRRRYAKMSLTSHATPPDTSTFITTGIPVILAEELDDPSVGGGLSPAAKPPTIIKEEKPPLYKKDSPRNSRSHPPSYQQPPPPNFSNGKGHSTPNSQPPAYRKPTYMPP